jgi:lipoate---protein ligase
LILRALGLRGHDPRANLAAEEALLERAASSEALLLFYVNDPCVVVGRNQNPWAEIRPGSGLPALRRVSGGGAVYHDAGNLNWSFIVPRSEHDREAELGLVLRALRDIGIDAAEGARGGLYLASGPEAGSKISGTARRLSAHRVLHHGTLLVDTDLRRLSSSLGGIGLDSSRALPSAPSPAAKLSSLQPSLSVGSLAAALASSIAGSGIEELGPEELGLLADSLYAAESEARLRSWEWTWGATPPFSLKLRWRGGDVLLEVNSGLIAAVSGPGSEALASAVGERFDYATPGSCLAVLEKIDVHELFISAV